MESLVDGEISSSSSKWKTGSDELFITCLFSDSITKEEKSINNYLDAFPIANFNYKSMRSHLMSDNNNNSKSKNDYEFKPTDLSPITFGLLLIPKLSSKKLPKF